MLRAKLVADAITTLRAGIGLILIWLGWQVGEEAIAVAAWLMLADWVGDFIDGIFARLSKQEIHTWIGDHDLEVDIFVSLGLMAYLWFAGFIEIQTIAYYMLGWAILILFAGYSRSLGMLFQTPIYLVLIWKALVFAPKAGWTILFWITALIIFTWPRFPKEVLPGFFSGIQQSIKARWKSFE